MPAPTGPLTGDALLTAVTDAMVAMHKRYHHRAPVTAKTMLMGDELLACVMGGVYTDVEKTLIEMQRQTVVQDSRSAFQDAMQDRFIGEVERLSGRRVLAVHLQQPRRARPRDRAVRARARGDRRLGERCGPLGLEPAALRGHQTPRGRARRRR